VIDVALTGWVKEDQVLLRRGAHPGDAILVTGLLGASGAGLAALRSGLAEGAFPELARALLAHHEPQPRLAEARAIALSLRASAMMDLSDGLADDLPRLCSQSKVGAQIHADRIPVDPVCSAVAARLGGPASDPLALAISGGEDYELLFTCPSQAVEDISAAVSQATRTPVTVIGEIVAEEKVVLVDARGAISPMPAGFDHFDLGGSSGLGGAESS
jgi:thiamine-monophosphate kinase